MSKGKGSKGVPPIDMTPMVDLAFLLVTFFMLSASFRTDEPVEVNIPSSSSDKLIPENIIQITIDKGGRLFFNMNGIEARKALLRRMSDKYKVGFTTEQYEKFSFMTTFGCKMGELPAYINGTGEVRKNFPTNGIPVDSLNNQLKDWIDFGNQEALNTGKTLYENEKLKGGNPDPNDFKPKFVLKVDGDANYVHAQGVINIFRDLNLNNLNFVTSLSAK